MVMQEKLFIYLHANDLAKPSWGTDSYTHLGETESLAQIANDREVILIVPAEDVVLLTIKFPKMSRSRLLQALPFALEEQFTVDVQDLHFAVGHYQQEGDLPVAVVAHAKMQQWLDLLQSWHVMANVIVPVTLVLPIENTTWHVLLHDMAIVRTGLFQGFAVDKKNFINVLQLALETNIDAPLQVNLNNYTDDKYIEKLNVTPSIKENFLKSEFLMSDLIKTGMNAPVLNLLQGKYTVKKAKFPTLQLGVKVVFYLMAAWVCLLFLYPSISYLILKQRMIALDNHIGHIYQQHFPQAASIVAPELRMQEKLQNLSQRSGENRPLLLLALIGKGIQAVPSIKLKRFDFQNEHLTLELTAATSEDFSAFTDYLMQQGLAVKQQSADFIEGRMRAMLQID
jgi:general secretion pathway protein L